ncbi:MAG: hypothetical protein KGZ39_05690 [Simkania sp.]|nr:hypothetical protein [Simkania sp.]
MAVPSLLGAIVELYKTSTLNDAVNLRTLIGNDSMYGDRLPSNAGQGIKPFVVLSEIRTQILNEAKSGRKRITVRNVFVTFFVFGKGREEVEAVLENLEDLYTDGAAQLQITNRVHNATRIADRSQSIGSDSWEGQLTLTFMLTKTQEELPCL